MSLKPADAWTRAEKDAARTVLLEPSPYESDGGELIGRDPRKIPAEDFAKAGLEGNPILKVLRSKCLDCACQQEAEVRKCVVVLCPNWPYRMGTNPLRAAREITEEQREQLVARMARAKGSFLLPGCLPSKFDAYFSGLKIRRADRRGRDSLRARG